MQDLARDFLQRNYLWISIGHVGVASSNVEQHFRDAAYLDEGDKFAILVQVIKDVKPSEGELARTMIFTNEKARIESLAERLRTVGIESAQFHGDLTQAEREKALFLFKDRRINVLIGTDVASRGLDVPGVEHVVNYDMPLTSDDYVHRVGRTGRIGHRGVATSLVGPVEPALTGIVKAMQQALQDDPKAP